MNGVQTRFKCKLDVKRCKRFVFPPSSLLPRSNALKTKAIRYFQTDRTLTRIVSPPLLAAQFESFKDPLIIMLTVPLAIAGALVFMYFGDITMNIFSQIGIIMLIGLVAKNGILIVEFANQKQEAGEDKMSAIKDAALQRLRPILMTSASTVLGLIPLAFASGEGANQRIAMGTAVVGGMVVSTLLTMYIVPAIYSYISTNRIKITKE